MDVGADLSARLGAPVVLLYAAEGPGLVLLRPTGVHYVNQVGGHEVMQAHAEGVYLPLAGFSGAKPGLLAGLQRHYADKYEGWGGFDAETADFVDGLLHDHLSPDVSVDRDRTDESTEAWIYVRMIEGAPKQLTAGFGAGAAVLTWPNSDSWNAARPRPSE